MVYSMLSSGIVWERVEKGIDILTGRINPIDDIFHNYDVDYILQCNPDQLADEIKNLGCASQSTRKQMKAIVSKNINKLISYEKEFGSIDSYYKKFIEQDNTLKLLVKQLADSKSENKFDEMAEALIAEYLKNVGYDIAKASSGRNINLLKVVPIESTRTKVLRQRLLKMQVLTRMNIRFCG